MTRSIHEIWAGVLAGDPKSWRELIDLYARLVFTVASRTGLSGADAEDCAQQVWINLYRRRRSVREPVALPAWLIRATHRRAISMNLRTRKQASVDETQEFASIRLPDEVVISLEESALIEIALSQLDERCRKLLRDLYFNSEEKTYQQVAQELRIKANSLGPLRSRCLHRLKKNLEKLGWRTD
jgi:RNA polymerase sigma factor (sigma-70 family)